jgi:hypothetical protein
MFSNESTNKAISKDSQIQTPEKHPKIDIKATSKNIIS